MPLAPSIAWYPGHMRRSVEELRRLSHRIDIYLYIVDIRCVQLPALEAFLLRHHDKICVVVFNKTDLCPTLDVLTWKNWAAQNLTTSYFFINKTTKLHWSKIRQRILQTILPKNMVFPLTVAIVGAPNVGKSTILNVLVRHHAAPTANIPGVTRHIHYYKLDQEFLLIDTPGIINAQHRTITNHELCLMLIKGLKITNAVQKENLITFAYETINDHNQVLISKLFSVPQPKNIEDFYTLISKKTHLPNHSPSCQQYILERFLSDKYQFCWEQAPTIQCN